MLTLVLQRESHTGVSRLGGRVRRTDRLDRARWNTAIYAGYIGYASVKLRDGLLPGSLIHHRSWSAQLEES